MEESDRKAGPFSFYIWKRSPQKGNYIPLAVFPRCLTRVTPVVQGINETESLLHFYWSLFSRNMSATVIEAALPLRCITPLYLLHMFRVDICSPYSRGRDYFGKVESRRLLSLTYLRSIAFLYSRSFVLILWRFMTPPLKCIHSSVRPPSETQTRSPMITRATTIVSLSVEFKFKNDFSKQLTGVSVS